MFHQNKGKTTRQAHVEIPKGTYEDEHGRKGFFGRASHLYHKNPPTNWVKIDGPCKPRAYNLLKTNAQTDPWQATFVLENEDVKLGFMQPSGSMKYFYRCSDGDLVYFIHEGSGTVDSDFGPLTYERGDYVVIPKGTTHRLSAGSGNQKYFVIESTSEVDLPDKGLLGRHALFDADCMKTPEPKAFEEKGEFIVRIKREGQMTDVTYSFHPLDCVGWKGDLTMFKVNIKDFRPVISHRYHLAPSVHSTFVGQGYVVCSFVPRPFESDETANRVPFYHRNIDCDEVIFYHDGDFFSRKNMGVGMLTFHPYGIHHGPHPGAAEGVKSKTMTNEYAVMVDTFKPLRPTAQAETCEWKDYHLSWRE
ncbi:MAG: homogentisate 1,2-dioxygenase [Oligoflexia bacterium]|nr:homogentisate 1,2-dioxygenase [Oligoflexia bacterium]